MFLSLVRPDRISSPITSRAAVTGSVDGDAVADVMARHGGGSTTRDHGWSSRVSHRARPHSLVGRPILPLWVMMHQAVSRARSRSRPQLAPLGRTRDARTGAATPDRLRP